MIICFSISIIFLSIMCFNETISGSLAILGAIGTLVQWYRGKIPTMVVFLFYTLMETLQTIQYFLLGDYYLNIFSTYIAFLLVLVQPFLWNWFRYKINKNKQVFTFAMVASFVWAIFFSSRLIPVDVNDTLEYYDFENIGVGPWCTTNKDSNHLYWLFPLKDNSGMEANYFTYVLLFFLPALWEDSYGVIKVVYWLTQLAVTNMVITNKHAYPSTWCIMSVPIITIMMIASFI